MPAVWTVPVSLPRSPGRRQIIFEGARCEPLQVYKAACNNDEPALAPLLRDLPLPALSFFIAAGAAAIQPGLRLDSTRSGRPSPGTNGRIDQGELHSAQCNLGCHTRMVRFRKHRNRGTIPYPAGFVPENQRCGSFVGRQSHDVKRFEGLRNQSSSRAVPSSYRTRSCRTGLRGRTWGEANIT